MPSPQRIVSLISSATEILFGIGAGERVVAVSHECDHPQEVQRLPKATRSLIDSARPSAEIDDQVLKLSGAGGALYELDAPLLRDLCPDLIVTQAQCDVCAVRYADVLDLVESEPALRGTSVVALNPLSLNDVFEDIRRLGLATGHSEKAEAFLQSLRDRVQALDHRTQFLSAEQRPRVACIEWIEPQMLAGNWTPSLIQLAGGQCGLAVAGRHSSYSKWQDLLDFDPQVLILSPCGFDLQRSQQEAEVLRSRPGWQEISAVKHGRVSVVDGNAYLNRSGPRLVDSLEILGHLIQPGILGPPAWAADMPSRPWSSF